MTPTHSYSDGQGPLPTAVLNQIQDEMFNYSNSGKSIMELSHKSILARDLIDDTVERLRKSLRLDDAWDLLLLQGGASQQFVMAPLNLSKEFDKVDYVDSGYWSQQAISEARHCARNVSIIASGENQHYQALPSIDTLNSRADARYLHLCTNNTVMGTQWHQLPDSPTPLLLDASSDFLSRDIPLENVNCLYAHAQKNIGLAGVTVVAVRKRAILNNNLPAYLDYMSHITAGSSYHTPPLFSIYVTNLMLKWLEEQIGGLSSMEEINRQKAKLIYDAIDDSRLFRTHVNESDRSLMNVVFSTGNSISDEAFAMYCKGRGINTIELHPRGTGLRASLYNAITIDDVQSLVTAMHMYQLTLSSLFFESAGVREARFTQ
ncbi:3-phosphoserine/phosphohydroxythreonine transaminase [Pontibacterium sp. N1Y112]|uniref:Phosphoserine aminotransferase n=1 Tax=Pontibacterium sinense TaxID=2781979 RepID=A0A8J7FRK8_9GAMM|nr:3-phosphoserine/phosphohydroxythreonine transaminase [Pontibacterium sinense]MBE9396090.1 3-phosphoserine/phosphohydroxythreonine transaminase [Pontibacterium sinense]